jgi:CHAT domain-containing protein/Tfp pilus assembly protein PilF
MTQSMFNSLAAVALFTLIGALPGSGGVVSGHLPQWNAFRKGVVVDRLSEAFEAQKAGMRVGDILLRWHRGNVDGEIDSPFTILYLRYEQAPRGRIRIDGLRRGRRRTWYLGSDTWGIWPRPNFQGNLVSDYERCRDLPSTADPEKLLGCWRAIAAETKNFGPGWLNSWLLSRAAQEIANEGNWQISDKAFEEAIADAPVSSPSTRGELRLQWALALKARQDWAGAGTQFQKAAKEWAKAERESVAIATPLLEVGAVAFEQGDFDQAESVWKSALNITQQLAPRSLEATLAYGNLAVLAQQRGNLAEAEDLYRHAIAEEELYIPGSAYLPQQLSNLGTLARERGDVRAAQSYHRQALMKLRSGGTANPLVANVLDGLADCYLDENEFLRAEQYQKRALSIREKLLPQSLDVASSLGSLGLIADRRGDVVGAGQYYRRALVMYERLAPQSTPTADVLARIGAVKQQLGDDTEAERYFRSALAILDKIAPGSTRHGEILASLAKTVRHTGRLELAEQLYRQALDDFEEQTAQLPDSDITRSLFRAKHDEYYRDYIDLLVEQTRTEEALETLERSHAHTLFEMLSHSQIEIRRDTDPILLTRERQLRESLYAKSKFRDLLLAGQKHTAREMNALDAELASLRTGYAEIEKEITASSPRYAALTTHGLNASQIQQLLDPDTLLLEYSLGERRSLLWAVTQRSVAVYELPPRRNIERLARQLYRIISVRPAASQPGSHGGERFNANAEYRKTAIALGRMILAPVSKSLPMRLVVVSEGALEYIPFSALCLPETKDPLLLEHEVVRLPSVSVLAELRRASRPRPTHEVAVLADPVFDVSDERVQQHRAATDRRLSNPFNGLEPPLSRSAADVGLTRSGGARFNRLIYTRLESQAIAAATPPGQAKQELDFAASREAAMSPDLANYRIVHFATHGLVDSKRPELSGLVLSLVTAKGQIQDGFLRLEDIYNLRLPVDMVVLSGCQTALGEEISGEGLIGLTRGFMYAGARRVVASLWSVDDLAASELMTRFYGAMERGQMRPAAALRTAQREMYRQQRWHSPYYWASFELQGEWR